MSGRKPKIRKQDRERIQRQEAACLYRYGRPDKANVKLRESQLLRALRRLLGG